MKKAVVLGGGGFIGGHMSKRLKSNGYWVRAVDIKEHEYFKPEEFCDDFQVADLRALNNVEQAIPSDCDLLIQLAADMGGAGYIFTGENDANVMHNSAMINLNVADVASRKNVGKVFYSSSACMYPSHNQEDPSNPNCKESSAYPANPDSEYGWEKLFSERLFFAFKRNYDLEVRVARFHNIYGPYGTWKGGKEKAPAAMLRKAAETQSGQEFEVWGSGKQTRSFLYVDDCVDSVLRLVESDYIGPVNIGSEEMVSINQLAQLAIDISGKDISYANIEGEAFLKKYGFECPVGVMGRNSDNRLFEEKVGELNPKSLREGMSNTYAWIADQLNNE